MKTTLVKLVQNELIKIFKRKSIYFLFILSIIAIIVYNYKNPDQNVINYRGSKNIPVDSDAFLNSIKNNTESYIYSLAYNEFAKLYNEDFEENSWQRYANE